MLALPASGAVLRRVSLRSADRDSLRLRQRVERVLAAVDWTPPGLPPRAILVVRRLAPAASRNDSTSFARRVSNEVARCARLARRPWIHGDATSADAVLFADEAELVACLIRDWVRGVAGDRWWWQGVLGGAGAERWLRARVLPRGDLLVPALSLLETHVDVVAWLASLPEADARAAAVPVADAFALPMPGADAHLAEVVTEKHDDAAPASAGERRLSSGETTAIARLTAMVPELRRSLPSPAHRRLIALVGVATRAPSWARTPQFAAAMRALDRIGTEQVDPQTILRVPPAVASERARLAGEPGDQPAQSAARTIVPSSPIQPRAETIVTRPSVTEAPPREIVARPVTSTADRSSSSVRIDGDLEDSMGQGVEDRTPRSSSEAEPPAAANADEQSTAVIAPIRDAGRVDAVLPPVLAATRIQTQYGGIFYLLNAWLAMGLYGDFTAPRAANFVLSPWDLLALVGRAWFGQAFALDPVWKVLADLAVRDPDEDPDCDGALPDGWLEEHLEALDVRLRAALGVEPAEDVALIVCRYRAAIAVTASSVNVHLELAELPLDIRVAGLDRDPGWIPAAGRAVYFHFA